MIHLNKDVIQVHKNQQRIDALILKNKQETQRLVRNSKKWVDAYDQLLYGLKEIGDLSNWSQMIEDDLKNVMAVIEIRKEQQSQVQ
ncbi:UNKNOWN [Stylonychia lemnae]|uniref:Biogenesis of lysosome-related organelles complex 1 subunit 1 n=1 Tax=Stylonychia lemnae TaxID=5949 RepID=A0A078B2M6_STYLE|nr:UNKNOWN [Stylonychia lemnae]|eukprot:CDW88734.1 UNKNOWN [Stylonychia lemnae]